MVLDTLYGVDFERVWLHQRFATQGEVSLASCHGWSYRGQIVMHNGVLRDPAAQRLPVDSMAIGRWLLNGTADAKLAAEGFANVFVVDTEAWQYTVYRSPGGSLYTDGNGNYSTEAIPGLINLPVLPGAEVHWVPVPERVMQRAAEGW
jgi:hypothetical protein